MRHAIAFRILLVAMFALTLLIFGDRSAKAEGWKQYEDLKEAGWSEADLAKAREFAGKIGTAAVMIVDHGQVVEAWGAVDHPFKTASIRKSIYDATIGATHRVKPFDLDTTVGKLGIDDLDPLDKLELSATFEQILTARSGVYHTAAYEARSNARRRPSRHSAKPGTLTVPAGGKPDREVAPGTLRAILRRAGLQQER